MEGPTTSADIGLCQDINIVNIVNQRGPMYQGKSSIYFNAGSKLQFFLKPLQGLPSRPSPCAREVPWES